MVQGSYLHRLHLYKLEAGQERVARGREIIERHKRLRQSLIDNNGRVPPTTETLLSLLEDCQRLAEGHLVWVKRAVEQGE